MSNTTQARRSLFGIVILLSIAAVTNAQQLPKGWTTITGNPESDPIPLGISMYSVFTHVTSIDEERPGYGARLITHTIGIEDEAKAAALSDYMITAFYAGRASSAEREREFCALDIITREDLIEGLQERELAHNSELDRLATGAANVVDSADYAKLVEYAETRRSQRSLIVFDPIVAYGTGNVDAEVASRCDDSK